MARLAAAGIHVGVSPGTMGARADPDMDDLKAVAEAAEASGACFLEGRPLYLMPGVKEHFEKFLDAEEPGLQRLYGRLYPGAYPPSWYGRQMEEILAGLRHGHGFDRRRFEAEPKEEQLALL